ncbi:MAG: DUF4238 domain-containing protein [Candidatus Izemoplasmatales bacterium]|nr:DUF4238 domain-containing protein [Candidatus Izemoplasmatales bacterium]
MAEKKAQHYVPKFYLKNFTTNNMINLVTFSNDNEIRLVPYNKQCYKDYMYGEDLVWENKLSDFESKWSILISDIIKKNKVDFSDEEMDIIKNFVVFQVMRTNRHVDIIESNMQNFNRKLMPIITKSKGIELSDGELAELINTQNSSFSRSEWTQFNLNLIESNKEKIQDLKILIIVNKTNTPFITSNHPAFTLNSYQKESGLGLLSAGIIYGIPLSPEYMIMLFDKQIYPIISNLTILDINNTRDIDELNYYQYKRSDGVIFSKDSKTLRDIIKFRISLQMECIKIITRSNICKKFPYYSIKYIDEVILDSQIKVEVLNKQNLIESIKYALHYDPKISFLKVHERANEFQDNENFIWIRNEKNETNINARLNLIMPNVESDKLNRFSSFVRDYCNEKLN